MERLNERRALLAFESLEHCFRRNRLGAVRRHFDHALPVGAGTFAVIHEPPKRTAFEQSGDVVGVQRDRTLGIGDRSLDLTQFSANSGAKATIWRDFVRRG